MHKQYRQSLQHPVPPVRGEGQEGTAQLGASGTGLKAGEQQEVFLSYLWSPLSTVQSEANTVDMS